MKPKLRSVATGAPNRLAVENISKSHRNPLYGLIVENFFKSFRTPVSSKLPSHKIRFVLQYTTRKNSFRRIFRR